MPVSPLPLLIPALLIIVPLCFRFKSKDACRRAAAVSISLVLILFLFVFIPGWYYQIRAFGGNAAAMFELARWTESHDGEIGEFILWPFSPDVLGGFEWLKKSADLDYPPAVYALGVRFKDGHPVPRPPNWRGPGGNVFEQPEKGQALIDKALKLGYTPTIDEVLFYFKQYRNRSFRF